MWETLESYWIRVVMISFFAAFPFFFLGVIQTILLLRQSGDKLKRGVKLYSRPLTSQEQEFLQKVQEDIFTKRKQQFLTFIENIVGFIRVKDDERLIQFRRPKWGTSWPYVGYVNLAQPVPELEYRASFFMHLFLIPIILTGIGLLFVIPMMFLNFRFETGAIDTYLLNQIVTTSSPDDEPSGYKIAPNESSLI